MSEQSYTQEDHPVLDASGDRCPGCRACANLARMRRSLSPRLKGEYRQALR